MWKVNYSYKKRALHDNIGQTAWTGLHRACTMAISVFSACFHQLEGHCIDLFNWLYVRTADIIYFKKKKGKECPLTHRLLQLLSMVLGAYTLKGKSKISWMGVSSKSCELLLTRTYLFVSPRRLHSDCDDAFKRSCEPNYSSKTFPFRLV